MKLLIKTTDYSKTIQLAISINEDYDKSVTFHCYWHGTLNEKHLYWRWFINDGKQMLPRDQVLLCNSVYSRTGCL